MKNNHFKRMLIFYRRRATGCNKKAAAAYCILNGGAAGKFNCLTNCRARHYNVFKIKYGTNL
jgi:hypothetical protein